MKYVKPHILYKAMENKTMELYKRGALRAYASLIAINVLDEYVSVGISLHRFGFIAHYSNIDRKDQTIHKIANKIRDISFVENVAGLVIALPYKSEDAKVESFVDDLRNTGKLEGLKYTYLKKNRFASKFMENTSEVTNDEFLRSVSGGYMLRLFLHRYKKNDESEMNSGPFKEVKEH